MTLPDLSQAELDGIRKDCLNEWVRSDSALALLDEVERRRSIEREILDLFVWGSQPWCAVRRVLGDQSQAPETQEPGGCDRTIHEALEELARELEREGKPYSVSILREARKIILERHPGPDDCWPDAEWPKGDAA